MDEMTRIVQQAVANVLGVPDDAVPTHAPLDDLGVDSFHLVNVVLSLERAFGIELPATAMRVPHQTVQDLAAVVSARATRS